MSRNGHTGARVLVLCIVVMVMVALCSSEKRSGGTAAPTDKHAGLRGACRQFIEQSMGDPRPLEFGEYWAWTVIDNADGTVSVGARFVAGQSPRYRTCVLRNNGGTIRLESLSRLQ